MSTSNYILAPDLPTLRDRFAMAALTGILAGPWRETSTVTIVRKAYDAADCMLAMRKQ
jgi:hypothetical protein